MKAKIAESEGRLLCSKCQGDMLPNKDGVYEFENFRPGYGPGIYRIKLGTSRGHTFDLLDDNDDCMSDIHFLYCLVHCPFDLLNTQGFKNPKLGL